MVTVIASLKMVAGYGEDYYCDRNQVNAGERQIFARILTIVRRGSVMLWPSAPGTLCIPTS